MWETYLLRRTSCSLCTPEKEQGELEVEEGEYDDIPVWWLYILISEIKARGGAINPKIVVALCDI